MRHNGVLPGEKFRALVGVQEDPEKDLVPVDSAFIILTQAHM
jgi:hypothetical protein